MSKKTQRVLSFFFVFLLSFGIMVPEECTLDAATVARQYESFYQKASSMVDRYWSSDYISELTYETGDTATMISGELYVNAETFAYDLTGDESKVTSNIITIQAQNTTVAISSSQSTIKINGESKELSKKPVKFHQNLMIPISEVATSMGYEVTTSKDSSAVTISAPFQTKRLIVHMKKGHSFSYKKYKPLEVVSGPNSMYILQFSTVQQTKNAYKKISKLKYVDYVEEDAYVTVDQQFTTQFLSDPISSQGNSHLSWGVDAMEVPLLEDKILSQQKNRGITVAVVDTGVDSSHSFLSGRVLSGYDFINNDSYPEDDNGHGTHVAGTIVDCTQNLDVSILPVKVLSVDGSGTNLTIASGISYAVSHNAKVINLSLCGPATSGSHYLDTVISNAIAKNVIIVVAAGNDSSDTAWYCPSHIGSAIVVAAIDSNYNRANFSNYGNSVDLAAPGVDIVSSIPGGQYASYSGTSMATPHIAALAAMFRLYYEDASVAQTETRMKDYVMDLGTTGWDIYYGTGVPMMSLAKDWSEVTPIPEVTPTVAPTVVPTVVPTGVPMPTYVPMPTSVPVPTSVPMPTPTPAPSYQYGLYMGVSTSTSSSNGYGTGTISVTTSQTVSKVILSLPDGRNITLSTSNGTNWSYSVSGYSPVILSGTVCAYDANGNLGASTSISLSW